MVFGYPGAVDVDLPLLKCAISYRCRDSGNKAGGLISVKLLARLPGNFRSSLKASARAVDSIQPAIVSRSVAQAQVYFDAPIAATQISARLPYTQHHLGGLRHRSGIVTGHSGIVPTDSGIVTSHSGHPLKLGTLNRNGGSAMLRNGWAG